MTKFLLDILRKEEERIKNLITNTTSKKKRAKLHRKLKAIRSQIANIYEGVDENTPELRGNHFVR